MRILNSITVAANMRTWQKSTNAKPFLSELLREKLLQLPARLKRLLLVDA
jgi:hypothetical protein